jgi:LPS export ABC transporter protein LptC
LPKVRRKSDRSLFKGLLWGLATLLILALVGWGILGGDGGRDEQEENETESSYVAPPPLMVRSLYLEEFDEGGKHLDLWGQSALFSRKGGQVQVQDVHVVWSAQKGGPSQKFELWGREGTYDLSGQIAMIHGDVEMRTWNGYTLRTDAARYDYQRHRIDGTGVVRIEGPEGVTEGEGFQVNLEHEMLVLEQKVRTLIRPSALEKTREDLPR